MRHRIVEGETGIFPIPIASLRRKLRELLGRRDRPPDAAPETDDARPPEGRSSDPTDTT
ncbi:MAG TPA: hypothetical protein VE575_14565 [Acidimicrobiales bacterium]|jgi:hypothetical protein|nr:hypothetical protein [Acidimicrobiales bacterium]